MPLDPNMHNLAQQVGEAYRHAIMACALSSPVMPTRNVPRLMISSSLEACWAHADVANDNRTITL
jgi:hypothetical protein